MIQSMEQQSCPLCREQRGEVLILNQELEALQGKMAALKMELDRREGVINSLRSTLVEMMREEK